MKARSAYCIRYVPDEKFHFQNICRTLSVALRKQWCFHIFQIRYIPNTEVDAIGRSCGSTVYTQQVDGRCRVH